MRTTKILILTLISLLLFQGCSIDMIVGGAVNSTRRGPENATKIKLIYEPLTILSIDSDAEYFGDIRGINNQALMYEDELVSELKSRNINCSYYESTRFSLSVSSMSFTETTSRQCENDEAGNQECFLLNNLSISMNLVLKDHLKGEEKEFSSRVYESSNIKKKLLGSGLTERDFGMSLETLTSRLIRKCAGKVSKYIRKNKDRK